MINLCLRALPLACLIGTAASAHAPVRLVSSDRDAVVRTTTVSIAGLDLDSPSGRRQLDRQLRDAAARVCGLPLMASDDGQHCRTAALADARRQADALTLSTRTAALSAASNQSFR